MDQATHLREDASRGEDNGRGGARTHSLDRLDDALTFLKQHREAKEICRALTQRIASASLDDFGKLKDIYSKHCG